MHVTAKGVALLRGKRGNWTVGASGGGDGGGTPRNCSVDMDMVRLFVWLSAYLWLIPLLTLDPWVTLSVTENCVNGARTSYR